MSLSKTLDRAIMQQETAAAHGLSAGYRIGEKVYGSYLSNESWRRFQEEMKKNHPTAYAHYAAGGGREMEERKVGKYTYPPKMASFGSSSRMIFELMKDDPDFLYEKKLPTTVGGVANLDGFMETDEKCVFVEAKCREPYGVKSNEIAENYMQLYDYLTRSPHNNLTCHIISVEKGKMEVRFFAGQKELQHFDIKQMICHLLGIATAYLQGTYRQPIDFIYLLYNPMQLPIENVAHRNKISDIYRAECAECASVDFSGLFADILAFLREAHRLGQERDVEKLAAAFSFRLCDQHTMYV